MNGRNIPYQLRTNKAVERQLFIDLLHWLDRSLRFENDFEYISMGGPFMEDFRQLHYRFPGLSMISIERDPQVAKRQRFNRPHCNIQFRLASSDKFIRNHGFQKKVVLWLDYTSAGFLVQQLTELGDVILKIPTPSIVKITLNAHLTAYLRGGDTEKKRFERAEHLRSLCKHLPLQWLTPAEMSEERFPFAIYRIVRDELTKRLEGHADIGFHPLASFQYADGQTMLTVTGLVAEPLEIRKVIGSSRLNRWSFFKPGWQGPTEIAVPELSNRERLFVQQLLPTLVRTGREIRSHLKYLIADDITQTEKLLEQYARFYRQFPNFERLAM